MSQRVIIVNGGPVGRRVAAMLGDYGHDPVVVDQETGRCEQSRAPRNGLITHGDAPGGRRTDRPGTSRYLRGAHRESGDEPRTLPTGEGPRRDDPDCGAGGAAGRSRRRRGRDGPADSCRGEGRRVPVGKPRCRRHRSDADRRPEDRTPTGPPVPPGSRTDSGRRGPHPSPGNPMSRRTRTGQGRDGSGRSPRYRRARAPNLTIRRRG